MHGSRREGRASRDVERSARPLIAHRAGSASNGRRNRCWQGHVLQCIVDGAKGQSVGCTLTDLVTWVIAGAKRDSGVQAARGVPEVDQGRDQRVRGRGGHVLARFPVAPRASSTPGCDGRGRARGFGCPTCPRPQCRAQAVGCQNSVRPADQVLRDDLGAEWPRTADDCTVGATPKSLGSVLVPPRTSPPLAGGARSSPSRLAQTWRERRQAGVRSGTTERRSVPWQLGRRQERTIWASLKRLSGAISGFGA